MKSVAREEMRQEGVREAIRGRAERWDKSTEKRKKGIYNEHKEGRGKHTKERM